MYMLQCYSVLWYVVIIVVDMLLLQFGQTALHYSCSCGHVEVVRNLINNNADISATDNVSDCSMFVV